ncbi:MAG: ATP-binding protein [Candidatus Kapabacteria bacterium]|nr:ATP-binding protein [Candidatus Kapabacteria bacterium]
MLAKNCQNYCNGEVSEVQFVGEDISDYLSVSEQEQTTQTNLQAVFDASIQSMWLLDTHLNVLSCNRLAASAIQTIFGKDPGIGESIFEYILPEQRQEVNINMQKALQGERIVHEAEFNGLWFEYQYAPVYNKRQEIIGITLTALDISLLKTSIRQLEQQQHFLETILAAIPGGIYIYDTTQNRNIYASPSITNVLGYSPAELQAMGENFLFHHVHEDDIPRIIGHLQEIQLSTVEQEATIEYRFRHKDGSWIWLSSKDVVFVRDSGGTIVQFLGMVSDITKKKEVEMEIIHLNEVLEYRVEERTKRLEDLNREKDEILSIAAHDLKNPIAGIRTGAEIITMLAAKQSFDKIEQYTRLTIGACETMVDIINNLLDVGKLESGTMTMNLQPTSLSVVQQIIDANQEIALRKGIILHQDIDASLVIRADEKAFRQVLDNMISNAIKYSQPWHPVYVSTAVHSKGNTRTVRISVRDEGPGLSEDDKTKLFGKFARLSAVPTAGESSTGLGLSIVKKLVELQHGQVWCDSELGQGATFTVELPMLQK